MKKVALAILFFLSAGTALSVHLAVRHPIFDAILENNLESVQQMVEENPQVIYEWHGFRQVLQYAEDNKKIKIAIFIKEAHDKLKKNNDLGIQLIPLAKENAVEAMKILVKQGANVNATDRSGESPLHSAVRYNQVKAAEYLLNCDANIEASYMHETPIIRAAASGYFEMFELLLARGAHLALGHRNALTAAVGVKNTQIVDLILDSHPHLSADRKISEHDRESAFEYAVVDKKSLDIATSFLTKKFVKATYFLDGRLLIQSIRSGHLELVKLLLNQELTKLSLDQRTEMVNRVDSRYETPLIIAAALGFPQLVKVLLDAKADINAKKNSGETALQMAHKFAIPDITESQELVSFSRIVVQKLRLPSKNHIEVIKVIKEWQDQNQAKIKDPDDREILATNYPEFDPKTLMSTWKHEIKTEY
jgi:ankyrin repeat protein